MGRTVGRAQGQDLIEPHFQVVPVPARRAGLGRDIVGGDDFGGCDQLADPGGVGFEGGEQRLEQRLALGCAPAFGWGRGDKIDDGGQHLLPGSGIPAGGTA